MIDEIDENNFFDGVIGGGEISDDNIRQDISDPKNLIASSPLDKQLARLMILNPEVNLDFRNANLKSLDVPTKQAILRDIQQVLGITPLRNE